MRNTKQKDTILSVINYSDKHLTAEGVYEEVKKIIPNISLGTVYRNLNNMVDSNLIRRIKTNDGFDHFDNVLIAHDHFICLACNRIFDIFEDVHVKKTLNVGIVMNYDIIYKGICNDCKEGNINYGTKRK